MHLKHLVPELSVVDVEKTLRFYRDTLRFEVVGQHEHDRLVWWASVKSGGTELKFARCEFAQSVLPFSTKESLVLHFYPDDVEAVHAALKARDYPVSDLRVTPDGLKECTVTDPDGYRLWFGQDRVGS